MGNLLWAEIKKIRRLNIVWITIFATVMVAGIVFISGWLTYNGSRDIDSAGWYMEMAQPLATLFVLHAVISLLGSYMICREEDDDTIKSLLLIPVNEAILHFSDLSVGMVLDFLKIYFLQGVGIFLAISPIIALVSYMKKGYWIALVLTEIYSFVGTFMCRSNTLKTIYPISAVFGVSGYYETPCQNRICSIIILLLCGCLSVFILKGFKYSEKN
ncbi:ABC transporter permease [Romboutsia lituseburensis]|uniref:ABC transporter permease n=1 Tax=Romboutsia lituseburensis TaxID=1537 RepID=UPI00215B7335|nr:ABC transporter permease [Romboutsia lituseburensis]MCR8747148.1 ABC transporter permease [Romboutsia lituseburensis]